MGSEGDGGSLCACVCVCMCACGCVRESLRIVVVARAVVMAAMGNANV